MKKQTIMESVLLIVAGLVIVMLINIVFCAGVGVYDENTNIDTVAIEEEFPEPASPEELGFADEDEGIIENPDLYADDSEPLPPDEDEMM